MTNFLNRSLAILSAGAILTGCSTMEKITSIDTDIVKDQTWVLTSINGNPTVAGSRVTMEIQPSMPDQGRISGKAPCNNYFGGYRITNNKISFTPLGATKMMCQMPAMEQEQMYLEAFPKLDSIEVRPDQLVLKNSKGNETLKYASESGVIRGEIKPTSGNFPAGAEIIIRLQEAGMPEGSSGVVGIERERLGRDIEGPLSYTLKYAPQLIKPGKEYEISAQVLNRGRLLYTTKMKPSVPLKPIPVISEKK